MNTGQSILTIGAMLLLSVLILRINSTLFYSGQVVSSSKLSLIAMSLAQSRLEEIKHKSFDESTVGNTINNLNLLTAPTSLGTETGETYPNFDDIDDYNKKTFKDTVQVDPNLPRNRLSNVEIFQDSCTVVYVSINNLDLAVNTRTWNKKITVRVTNKTMKDVITTSTIYSYWVF